MIRSPILPAPLVPPDTDLRGLDGFTLNIERLMASELWALSTGDEFKAALALWCQAWRQFPAASLPNDDRMLATFSGAGDRWHEVRDVALRGFVLCSDQRLYHRVLAPAAILEFDRHKKHGKKISNTRNRVRKWREARASGNALRTRYVTRTKRVTESDPIEKQKDPLAAPDLFSGIGDSLSETTSPPKPRRRKPQTPMPDGFAPAPMHYDLATELGRDERWLLEFVETMRNQCGAKDYRYANWNLALSEWMRRSVKREVERGYGNGNGYYETRAERRDREAGEATARAARSFAAKHGIDLDEMP